jgi:predicted phosphodiesterase
MIRIAHISDIHIRSLSRHGEYFQIFTDFIQRCKEQKVDHIFVGGDIFHTKTQNLSPEYIDFMTWWLTAMAEICDVHITLGNHDGNLVNASRQDAVSPIIKALNNSRIHLYKQSGSYEFAPGYVWCVFSLFDEKGWKNVKPIVGKINIACYHGQVLGSMTETGWEVEDGLKVDDFREYDFGFLGDIHKLQFLDFRDVELIIDEKDLDSYPGAEVLERLVDG